MENRTNLDKGREGVKNPGIFADVICTRPLRHASTPSLFSSLWDKLSSGHIAGSLFLQLRSLLRRGNKVHG